jgi:hypothetical protein
MADFALTPTDFANQTMETARSGLIPASIGALGAGLGLVALTPFLAPASVPMSVLGMVLAGHKRNWLAMSLGALGIALALSALLQSGEFWVVFATVFSSLKPV